MASYDKTINRLAQSKAKQSPNQRLADLNAVNSDLRVLNKKNQDTKNFLEYKTSQIVRCQDRLRQTTLSSRFKQFSKLARDVEMTQSSGLAVNSQLLKKSQSRNSLTTSRLGGAQQRLQSQDFSKKFEHIIEQTKTNRKIKEFTNASNAQKPKSINKSLLNASQMSLTDFYLSQTKCDLSKLKLKNGTY